MQRELELVATDRKETSNKFLEVKKADERISSVQSLSRVRLFATPWITARQASLSITNSWSSLRLTSFESVMPSSHLILGRPLLLLPSIFPSIRVLSNESVLCIRWPSGGTGVSASASILPVNAQDWSPLGWTGWISLQSKGLSRVFSNTTVQKLIKSVTVLKIIRGFENHLSIFLVSDCCIVNSVNLGSCLKPVCSGVICFAAIGTVNSGSNRWWWAVRSCWTFSLNWPRSKLGYVIFKKVSS